MNVCVYNYTCVCVCACRHRVSWIKSGQNVLFHKTFGVHAIQHKLVLTILFPPKILFCHMTKMKQSTHEVTENIIKILLVINIRKKSLL